MKQIDHFDRPQPRDDMEEGASMDDAVDEALAARKVDRNADVSQGPTGEITNPETQYGDHFEDRPETDPFTPQHQDVETDAAITNDV